MKINKYVKRATIEVVHNCGWGTPGTIVELWRENDRLVGIDRFGRKEIFNDKVYLGTEDEGYPIKAWAIKNNEAPFCKIISMTKQTKKQYAIERLM